ncbi:MAG: iron-containing redox enzyme family protein [Methylovulum sp.]|uniref:iron-containing redox enzyme family protein n=1 Tax=Methylovulum sp. TaxID=1916980 RepID=UPI00260AB874|nr:iron-containing redox enzyme family protein [Methylovulum sp.]MDD2723197.1 iron-containing redox enzyme family protein [Methylovulum sp.]MDD5123138.1 iron-containing redox enzyme family protein [Methylovulum sp.]
MKNPSISDEVYAIQELEVLAEKAANTFKPFLGANGFDLEQYKQFLNTMYHYTARSGEMIRHAGNIAHNEELKKYFNHMVSEEQAHYILAREDLRELGDDVSEAIPQSVKNFHARWFNLGDNIYPYLGAVYVFENIAKHLQMEGNVFFERLGLNKKQKRWVAIHLEADLIHGEEIIDLCSRYFDNNPVACLEGGKMMCGSWISVFTDFNSH